MEISKLTLFSMVKNRMSWLGQRQEIIAQNIANSDTPRYKPSDLKPYNFEELLRNKSAQLNLDASGENHIQGARRRIRDFSAQVERRPFETAPNGNAVILEEQMAKLNETQINHELTTQLYKKHLNMIRMAIGSK
ncbi:MAG: flagellar basal body rod protein FlgB [Rhodospirillales bacterium]|nr:flagellar basal body rod protein FlgB [Rhodospirillales bacterium]